MRTATYPRAKAKRRSIHSAAAARGLRFEDVAKAAGVGKTTVLSIGQGRECPLATAEKIAAALGVKVDKLFKVIERDPKAKPEQLTLPTARSASEKP